MGGGVPGGYAIEQAKPTYSLNPEMYFYNEITTLVNSPPFIHSTEKEKRSMVGNTVYEIIYSEYGEAVAPKICGMIIDLPFYELLQTMSNLSVFKNKCKMALDLLKSDT